MNKRIISFLLILSCLCFLADVSLIAQDNELTKQSSQAVEFGKAPEKAESAFEEPSSASKEASTETVAASKVPAADASSDTASKAPEALAETADVSSLQAVAEKASGEFETFEDSVEKEKTGIDEKTVEAELKPGYVTVNFKGADIRAVLNYLSDVGGVDIVPSPDVAGPITLKLTNKPWETALEIIVRNYGYAYERERDIIRVVTVENLNMEELSTEVLPLNYAKAANISKTIENMISERGKVIADLRTNSLVATDVPTNIYKIKQVLLKLDKKTPQIMIEAKIIETGLSKDERMGIDWNIKVIASGAKRPTTFPFQVFGGLSVLPHEQYEYYPRGMPAQDSSTTGTGGAVGQTTDSEFPIDWVAPFPYVEVDAFTMGTLDFSQFQVILEFLKQRADTEIVSNPRVTTLNNTEAKILVGKVYNFPTFSQAEETGRWIISGYESKELGIKLLVTPNLNENGDIVVELRPEISNFLGLEQISPELSAPLWSTREAETQVMVRDGDTIFIGGLIRENNITRTNKFPLLGDLLGDIPLIGGLVKYDSEQIEKTELIFFITVNIVKSLDQLNLMATNDMSEVFIPMEDTMQPKGSKENNAVMAENKVNPWFDFRKKTKENPVENTDQD